MNRKNRLTAKLALAGCAALAPFAAAFAQERVWTLSGFDGKKRERVTLGYGAPETDDSLGAFRCNRGSGMATLFISTTSDRFKPGRKATATLSAGETRTTIAGKLLPNEEAGVPSFEGRLPAADPIFEALAGGETMTVAIGSSKQSAPLKGAADIFRKFVAACAKP